MTTATQKRPNWDGVLALLPALKATNFRAGAWRSPRGQLPYFELGPVATRLLKVLYDSGVVYDFKWPSWQARAEQLVRDPTALSRVRMQTLRKLLVTHVRRDRFCEGHFANMLESGHIAAILTRVAELQSRRNRK